MGKLVCPMCSESLEEEGSHFYKHFKYKRYACGTNSCESQFYTEADRNEHCRKHNHKRSFEKTVNPYIDKMISIVIEDARELATKDMETVLENRWGIPGPVTQKVNNLQATQAPSESVAVMKKRNIVVNPTTATPNAKKSRIGVALSGTSAASSSTVANDSTATLSRNHFHRHTEHPSSAASSSSQPAQLESNISTQAVADSTSTNTSVAKSPRKARQKKDERVNGEPQRRTSGSAYNLQNEGLPTMVMVSGWYDENAPEIRDVPKIKCELCKKEIVYDYIVRRLHVTAEHMEADTGEADYKEVLKSKMDLCYPDYPNSTLSCQVCMRPRLEIRPDSRREHIEDHHTTSIPDLKCPMKPCEIGFRRQCHLSRHMREDHKELMSKYKDKEFQTARLERNKFINLLIKQCFPWSELEKIEDKSKKTGSSPAVQPPINSPFVRDVRVREANKTRRAPQYNTNDSSDSDSDQEESVTSAAECAEVSEEDIQFICTIIHSEITQNLRDKRGASLAQIKQEVVNSDDNVLNDEPMEEVELPAKEEVEEPPKEEPNYRTHRPPPNRSHTSPYPRSRTSSVSAAEYIYRPPNRTPSYHGNVSSHSWQNNNNNNSSFEHQRHANRFNRSRGNSSRNVGPAPNRQNSSRNHSRNAPQSSSRHRSTDRNYRGSHDSSFSNHRNRW